MIPLSRQLKPVQGCNQVVYIEATDGNIDQRVRQVCAPLFATGFALEKGHDESVTSATVTFFKFQSRMYAVTCHHVLSAFFKKAASEGYRISPSIHAGRVIHQFGSIGSHGAYRWAFQSCREFPTSETINDERALADLERRNADRSDIAIADLTGNWSIFRNAGAAAIDLDSAIEPDWSATQPVWMAYGFPDGHKYRAGNKIAAPMPRVSAELVSGPTADRPQFTLCSTLTVEHGWGFSGLSGGPVLVAHTTEDRYAFVGITFAGNPSTKDLQANPEAFITKSDILLVGYYVGPKEFQRWLSQREFCVTLT
jgi:hypothetical protein